MSEAKKLWVNEHTGFWEYDPATIKPDVDYYVPVVMYEQYQALRDERDRLRATIRTLCSSGNRLLDDLIGRSDAAESFKYHIKQAQAALTPAGQRWTRRKPTKPGWYWWRRPGYEVSMLNVYESPIGLRMWLPGDEEKGGSIAVDQCYDDTEFLGPLAPNEATE